MKVTGTSRVRTSALRKTSRANGSAGQAFSVENTGGTGTVAQVSAPAAITAVDSLLALQEVEDSTQGRRKAVKRAEDILDKLDSLRMGLITGAIPMAHLRALIRLVEARRDSFSDPALSALIDEVELRARVEIAKLEGIRSQIK